MRVAFRLWMLLFFSATGAIVSGALPLDPVQQVLAIYAFELLTIVALWGVYHWHWAPAARHADRRLLEKEPGQVP